MARSYKTLRIQEPYFRNKSLQQIIDKCWNICLKKMYDQKRNYGWVKRSLCSISPAILFWSSADRVSLSLYQRSYWTRIHFRDYFTRCRIEIKTAVWFFTFKLRRNTNREYSGSCGQDNYGISSEISGHNDEPTDSDSSASTITESDSY